MVEPSENIRVMIVDDHAMMRIGLSTSLEVADDIELVEKAASGVEAIELYQEHRPDIVLMDLVMPGFDGIETIKRIREIDAEARIIVLTSFIEDDLVQKAMKAGATGYLLKNISPYELIDYIRKARQGSPVLSPQAAKALINSATSTPPRQYNLTAREREVLKLLAEGLSNPQIAPRLAISPYTVKTHVSNILAKLNVSSRTEAVAVAIQEDILQME